jgi:hypothetical protein
VLNEQYGLRHIVIVHSTTRGRSLLQDARRAVHRTVACAPPRR